MSYVSSLTSGLALISAIAQSESPQQSATASGASTASPSTSPGRGFTMSISASQAGVVTSIVNQQLNQSEMNQGEQYYASSIQSIVGTIAANDSLSSQQISQDLYSGQGLSNPGIANNDTLQNYTALLQAQASDTENEASQVGEWLAQGRPAKPSENVNPLAFQSMSDDQVQSFVTSLQQQATGLATEAKQLNQAFANGTLAFEKATDFAGLNFSQTENYSASPDGNGMSVSANISCNDDALATSSDGTQHALIWVGGVAIVASWNDASKPSAA